MKLFFGFLIGFLVLFYESSLFSRELGCNTFYSKEPKTQEPSSEAHLTLEQKIINMLWRGTKNHPEIQLSELLEKEASQINEKFKQIVKELSKTGMDNKIEAQQIISSKAIDAYHALVVELQKAHSRRDKKEHEYKNLKLEFEQGMQNVNLCSERMSKVLEESLRQIDEAEKLIQSLQTEINSLENTKISLSDFLKVHHHSLSLNTDFNLINRIEIQINYYLSSISTLYNYINLRKKQESNIRVLLSISIPEVTLSYMSVKASLGLDLTEVDKVKKNGEVFSKLKEILKLELSKSQNTSNGKVLIGLLKSSEKEQPHELMIILMDGLQKILSSEKEGFEGFSAKDIMDISSLIYSGSIGENTSEIFFLLMDVNKKAQKTMYDKGSGIVNPLVLLNFLSPLEVLLIPQLVEYFKVLIDDRIQDIKKTNELLLLEEPKIGFFDKFFSREKQIQAILKLKKFKQVNLYLHYLQQTKIFLDKSLTPENHLNSELSLLTENLVAFNEAKLTHSDYSFEIVLAAKEQEFEEKEWKIKWNSHAGKWSLNIDFKNGKFFLRQNL